MSEVRKFERVEVPWGKFKWAGSPSNLRTRWLGLCIGVTLYDSTEKMGHMAHILATERSQEKVIPPMLDSVRAYCNLPEMIGWLTGGAPFGTPENANEYLDLRENALAAILDFGIPLSRLNIDWAETKFDGVDIELDCQTGAYDLRRYRL